MRVRLYGSPAPYSAFGWAWHFIKFVGAVFFIGAGLVFAGNVVMLLLLGLGYLVNGGG